MQMMDHSIADAYFKGFIGREEAIARSGNPAKMEKTLKPSEVHAGKQTVSSIIE
jgi:hypothetical protein